MQWFIEREFAGEAAKEAAQRSEEAQQRGGVSGGKLALA